MGLDVTGPQSHKIGRKKKFKEGRKLDHIDQPFTF